MTLPTDGFKVNLIKYSVHAEGDYSTEVSGGFFVNAEFEPFTSSSTGAIDETLTAAWMGAIEAGLQAMADAMDALDDVTDVKIYRAFNGYKLFGSSSTAEDIRD